METLRQRPVLIFDGECGFCRFWATRWQGATGEAIEYRASQEVAGEYPSIPAGAFEEAVQWVEAPEDETGEPRVKSGADAVWEVLRRAGFAWRLLAWLMTLPGVMPQARRAYRFVAGHRAVFGRLTRRLWGRKAETALPPRYQFSSWLFLRLLGGILFIAFTSLLVQICGLVGSEGILPVGPYLAQVHEHLGAAAYRRLPTFFWLGSSDTALTAACWAGIVCSLLILFNRFTGAALLAAWMLYLSLSGAGQLFMSFQWDVLLLEVTLLAAFFVSPLQWRPRAGDGKGVARLARWLLLYLLARLMIESAVIKLASGDETWWSLTALKYHFETQPLPLPTAWWLHQAPLWLLKAGCLLMFVVEIAGPLCLLLPRRLRIVGAAALVGLQGAIAATGNYNFFNLLSAALCVLMIDDTFWPRRWRRKLGLLLPVDQRDLSDPARPLLAVPVRPPSPKPAPPPRGWHWGPAVPVAFASLFIGTMGFVSVFRPGKEFPAWTQWVSDTLGPLRSFNRYGLFARMTTTRPEIILEGSQDGKEWQPYPFRWKPGEVNRRPGLAAPHQPRLDWQMWFAALGDLEHNRWMIRLIEQLLKGSPPVLALLEENPFPNHPPRFVRATLYRYEFTGPGESTAWWRREELRVYCPPASLRASSASE